MTALSRLWDRPRVRNMILVALVVGTIVFMKAPTLFQPIGKNAGIFLYMADQWLDGALPYRDSIYDTKPPGIYLTFAAPMALFRGSEIGPRLFEMLWSVASALAMFALVRRIFRPATAWTVAFLFAVLSNGGHITAGGLNTEYYMILPVIVAAYFLVSWIQNPRPWKLVALGVAVGFGALYKQVAVFDLVAFSLIIAWVRVRQPKPAVTMVASMANIGLGFIIPVTISIGYFALNGALVDYYKAVTYPFLMEQRWTVETISQLGVKTYSMFSGPLLVASVLTVISLVLSRRGPRKVITAFPFIWLGFATLGALSGGIGSRQYYVQVVPPLCICAALAIDMIATARPPLWDRSSMLSPYRVALPLLLLALLWTSALESAVYSFGDDLFRERPRTDDEIVASYIKSHTEPDDYIYAWCTCAWVYVLTDRCSSSPYLNDHILGQYSPNRTDLNESIRRDFIADLTERPPAVFVFWSWSHEGVLKLFKEIAPTYLPHFESQYERIEVEGNALYVLM